MADKKTSQEFPPPFKPTEAAEAPPKLVMFIAALIHQHLPVKDVEHALHIGLRRQGEQAIDPGLYEYAAKMARALVSED